MNTVSTHKGLGYLTSTASVLLLGAVSLKAAQESALLMACLLLGVITAILGMCLRWRSHRIEQREKGTS
ncbi:MAG: hypothetical protein EON59_00380 [Alphaproteobacteria bacterium]|nr:MAG: hypothetical protein EON59_00380 [Alphaproteobacteria bacterium]